MDPNRIDDLARVIGSGQSRRRILKGLAGGALTAVAATLGLAAADAASAKRAMGSVCSKNNDCSSNVCLPKDRSGRRHCGCGSTYECPSVNGQCTAGVVCTAGICTGLSCDASGATNSGCEGGVCCEKTVSPGSFCSATVACCQLGAPGSRTCVSGSCCVNSGFPTANANQCCSGQHVSNVSYFCV